MIFDAPSCSMRHGGDDLHEGLELARWRWVNDSKSGQITIIPKIELRGFWWGFPYSHHHFGWRFGRDEICPVNCIGFYRYIFVWPPPCNSDHQDHYMFSTGFLLTFTFHCYREGAISKVHLFGTYGKQKRNWTAEHEPQFGAVWSSKRNCKQWTLTEKFDTKNF